MPRWYFMILFFALLAVVITWPLVLHPTTLINGTYDEYLIAWYLNWSIAHPGNFNANIFYPYQNTLGYSDMMLPQAVMAWPVVVIFGQPLLAYNFTLFSGFVLTGYATFLLIKFLTKSFWRGVFFSLIFVLSPAYLDWSIRLQLLSAWPWIFAIYFLVTKRWKWFSFFVFIAATTNILTLYFLLIFILLTWDKKAILYFGVGALLAVPFLWPYIAVKRQFPDARPITDAIHFSLYWQEIFVKNLPGGKIGAYPGLAIFAMAVLVVRQFSRNIFAIASLVFLVLAFGPAFHIFQNTIHVGQVPGIPMPYAILYYLVPGMSGFRSVWLWVLPAYLFLVIFAALKLKLNKTIILILTVMVLLEIKPMNFYKVPNFPPEQIWLRDHYVGQPIIQFPIYNWDSGNDYRFEEEREFYSTIHWHPMFNGFSGFVPKERQEKIKWLQANFPSPKTVTYLREVGIKLVVSDKIVPGLKLVAVFKEKNIYTL